MKQTFLKAVLLPALVACLSGCEGMQGRPERKKLPQLTADESWEGRPAAGTGHEQYPETFYAYHDTLISGRTYVAVQLQKPTLDTVAMALANAYEPLAGNFLAMLRQQGKSGILIDLRSPGQETAQQAGFQVQHDSGSSLPVVFVWDRYSAARAALLIRRLEQATSIRVTSLKTDF
ncbi:MAG: hypothetical protein P0Y53_20440 [Candidatus Pseudobacter hemicellulosilyticus]|uniref:Uncharacterized protein n=1 Tax=Candidatus Pseudobacter hemicellulosilyticus TaxID=3121375 RepID=A0AAJ6BF85_9BACT|nr:MAG: hypothetical protein P0Y53_20440 [Pseudobacter sp.]